MEGSTGIRGYSTVASLSTSPRRRVHPFAFFRQGFSAVRLISGLMRRHDIRSLPSMITPGDILCIPLWNSTSLCSFIYAFFSRRIEGLTKLLANFGRGRLIPEILKPTSASPELNPFGQRYSYHHYRDQPCDLQDTHTSDSDTSHSSMHTISHFHGR